VCEKEGVRVCVRERGRERECARVAHKVMPVIFSQKIFIGSYCEDVLMLHTHCLLGNTQFCHSRSLTDGIVRHCCSVAIYLKSLMLYISD